MAMSSFDKDMNIIQQLSDEPNDRDGLTAGELKAKFDEGGLAVKDYLNNTVKPYVDGLEEETETHEADAVRHITASERTAWNNKVDKVTGKGLSTNDYTTAEKNKLAGIEAQANKYVHPSYTARTGKPTGNLTPGFGDTVTVSQITSDALGHVTGATDRTIKIPATAASTSAAGLMSAADKTKLNGIAAGAQVNSITGVKGNAESSYRTGNVNLTPANIGAARASHTHAMSDVTGLTTAVQYGPTGLVSFQGSEDFPLAGCVADITPVQTGSGGPSPSNVRPITGFDSAVVFRAGKNLFDKTRAENVFIGADGSVTAASNARCSGYIPINGVCTCSVQRIGTGTDNLLRVAVYDANRNFLYRTLSSSATEGNYNTVTINDQSAKYVRAGIFTGSQDVNTMQVEFGASRTSYEPFAGPSYSFDWSGQAGTVYGGTLDVLTGVLTVDRLGKVFDGTESWVVGSSGENKFFRYTDTRATAKENTGTSLARASSHFPNNIITGSTTSVGYYVYTGSDRSDCYIQFRPGISGVDTLTTWTAWLAQQASNGTPLTCWWEINEPIIYQLTPQQVTAVAGANNIWADTGNVTVEYGAFPGALQRELQRELPRAFETYYITAGKKSGTTLGSKATAEGQNTTASGRFSPHAEGVGTVASGETGAHAEGSDTEASGEFGAHAEGVNTVASGRMGAHAEGSDTEASGDNGSHAEGYHTVAAGEAQHVFGKYNVLDTEKVEIVGWGSYATKKNIRTLDRSGNMTINGTLTQSSDARLKDVQGEVPDVFGIRAVRFKWNDTNGEHDDKDHIGYIAQDVEKLAPFMVGDDSNGFKSLDYIALLVAKVEWLERRVAEMENR